MASDFRVLSLIPPMTQLNTPYPSTAYLTGFLRSRGIAAVQEDLALALVLKLFTPAGLEALRGCALLVSALALRAPGHSLLRYSIPSISFTSSSGVVVGA